MRDAAIFFFACAVIGIFLGRGWDAAAIALCLILLTLIGNPPAFS